MKVRPDTSGKNGSDHTGEPLNHSIQSWQSTAGLGHKKTLTVFHQCRSTLFDQSAPKYSGNAFSEQFSTDSSTMAQSQNVISGCDLDAVELSEDSRSISDTFSSTENGNDENDNDFSPEMQQAYRIFQSFLLDKHKAVIAPFWFPVGDQTENDMCLKKIDSKFVKREYGSITEFVADFRLMLENCYRFHGVDNWISKQAQKLELMLEQKLTLLPRTLREKTTLAVTSRGRFNTEDEKSQLGTSNRRRSVPRNLAPVTVGGSESVMVQVLRLEEQHRAKEEKRQRDLERKEAGEVSAKEVEEWESSLLSLAEPWAINTMWELPAIGHFLCLAQTALNLPEIVFFELERCLLMPRCSSFLAKVVTSLLCPPHRRMTLHRRPALPYRRWEAELRQRVSGWYQSVGRAKDQEACAEQLGLCHRFFWTLGETSPLEEKPFHLLPFNQRVWLLKGLCDNVYETQKDVQDAVLGQPIHECRESILGYDGQENAYIHFPHFCGADLRIYCQSPCAPLEFPLPPFCVKKLAPKAADIMEEHLDSCLKDKEENVYLCLRGNKDDSIPDNSLEENELEAKKPDEFWFPYQEELSNLKGITEEPMDVEQKVDLQEDSKNHFDFELTTSVGKNCSKKCILANSLSTNTSKPFLLPKMDAKDNLQGGPCPKCSTGSRVNSEPHTCPCFKAEFDRTDSVVPHQVRHLKAETGTKCSKKNKRKKKREHSFRLKKLRRTRDVKNTQCNAPANLKRNKWKKPKIGKKDVPSKTNDKKEEPLRLPVEPTFRLVCTSVDELRTLISKTEDELDELASIKKRCGRWSVKQDAVTELHLTLIRLLNELLPWEPKLLKAFQRNRARLKKESDDFKKLPEYNNFVREEPVVAEDDRAACKEGSSSETSRDVKDEDESRMILKGPPGERGIDSTGRSVNRPDVNTTLSLSRPLTRSLKLFQSARLNDDFSLGAKVRMAIHDSVTPEPQSEVPSRDQITTGRASVETAPLGSLQRRCKPIQALLAKSVGNKVTLLSHPQNTRMADALKVPNETVSAAVSTTELTTVGPSTSQSVPKPNPQSTPKPAPQPASTPSQILTTSSAQGPVQIVYKLPEGLSLLQNDGTPVGFSVQPVTEQETQKNVSQQVFILPSNLLIQKTEGTSAQQSFSIKPVPTSSPATLLSSTSHLSVPENRIPVQQVAPLSDNFALKPSSGVSTSPQNSKHYISPTGHQKATELNFPTPTSVSTDPNKCDLKQELKTVCIRDSQSILVTTRGGNTGVVKVQTSDKSGAGILPSSPVFTMPPPIQTFLVSKTSTPTMPAVQTAHTTNPGRLFPSVPSLIDKGNSFKSAPQSPFKSVSLANSSLLIEKQGDTVTLNEYLPTPIESISINAAKNPIINPIFSTNLQTNADVPQSVQTTAFKSITKPPQKRSHVTSIDQDQSLFSKVFLLTSTTNSPFSASGITNTTAPSVFGGSRVTFMSQSSSACSTITTVAKGSVTSGSSTTAASTQQARPYFGQSISSPTTGTQVHGINVSGLTARILNETTVANERTALSATKVGPGVVANVPETSSSRLVFVQNSNPAGNSTSALNAKVPLRVTASFDGKPVTLSTFSSGHMSSSALVSAVQQNNTSLFISTTVSKPEVAPPASDNTPPSLGNSVPSNPFFTRVLTGEKPWVTSSISTASSVVNPAIITSVPRVSQTVSTKTATCALSSLSPASQPVVSSLAKSPLKAIPGITRPQERVVINTSVPLAPGTQLLINNTRFVVPAQGLGPGSHILLISNPSVRSPGPLGQIPRATGTQMIQPVAPGMQSQHTPIRLPAPITAKVGPSVSVHQLLTPLVSQETRLETAHTSGQQRLPSVVRLPSFLHPEEKERPVSSLHSVTNWPNQSVAVPAQSQKHLLSAATPTVVPTSLLNLAPKPQLPTTTTSVKTLSMSSTGSRMQTLPVATVPPNVGAITSSPATCVATVNKLIMATCQPIRPVQPGNTHPLQVQVPAQKTTHTPSKLLLSPDGAVLNVVTSQVLQNLPVLPSTMKVQVVGTTSNAPALDTIDSQSILTSDNPAGPGH
ncbi:uncharacterized protein KIAA2026-like [Trichomycterus rosablanca]|uniref:uncharacterized protein KIAA2026-like n=1 Tax=Trichomycterus rosablanca TaxID=2290929 RepID=UPI002F35396B